MSKEKQEIIALQPELKEVAQKSNLELTTAEKLAAELKAKNDAEKQAQETEKARIEAEEAERLAKEKAFANAGDKEKVKVFFGQFTAIEFPELSSEEGKKMSIRVKEALSMVKQLIINDSKSLL